MDAGGESKGGGDAAGYAKTPRWMGRWRLAACTLGYAGVQLSYAVQINLGTSQLLLLGISPRALSYAWLAGPLAGLVAQPVVGLLSDRCTSPLGRRRPFLITGALLTAGSLVLFGSAAPLARLLARVRGTSLPPPGGAGEWEGAALAIAIVAFFLLDFSVQAVQAPLRTLAVEMVPHAQRASANAFLAGFAGLGNLVGGLLAASSLAAVLPGFRDDAQAVFTAAAVLLTATMLPCVTLAPDPPLPRGYTPIPSLASPGRRRNLLTALRSTPRPFWQVFAVQLCTWCGFFTLFVFVNAWVGSNVYGGDGSAGAGTPARETFEQGVRLGGLGNALTAVVTLLYARAVPFLWRRMGVQKVYVFSQLTQATCLLVAPLFHNAPGKPPSLPLKIATVVDISAFGVLWATTLAVPWTLISNALDDEPYYVERKGLYMTVFNVSQALPQLVVALGTPLVLAIADNDPAWVMFVGGVFALVGAVLIVVLRITE